MDMVAESELRLLGAKVPRRPTAVVADLPKRGTGVETPLSYWCQLVIAPPAVTSDLSSGLPSSSTSLTGPLPRLSGTTVRTYFIFTQT